MTISPTRRRWICGAILTGLAASPAAAQMTVHDPSNYASNLLQAARALEQINNQIRSLQNQAQSLANEARNLAQLPYSALESIQTSLTAIGDLLGRAQRVAYDVGAIEQTFAREYRVAASATDLELVAAARSRWANSAEAFREALTVQAGVVSGLTGTQTEILAIAQASQGAVGIVQAAQAGNQLLALQSQQLAELTAILAAQGRAEALRESDRAASRAQAQEHFRRFVSPGSGYRPQAVEMFR
jgi:P-type conjugative transfer protein TrbJ